MGPTLLIGLDGATFSVLDPYMEDGLMPALAGVCERGTRAVLRSIMPPLTPPAWTSLVTGKHPGQHGIFDFFQKDEPGSVYFSFASSQEVRSATIWTLASEQERRVISLNFPLIFPAPPVAGAVVPGGMMPWRQLRLGCHPPGLYDRLKALPGFNPREMLDMELEIKAIDGCPEAELADFIELHIRREQRWGEVLRHLMSTEQADLVAVLFDGVDKLQHLCWRFIDPACRPDRPDAWEREMIELCERYFRSLDDQIAQILALAGDEATIVLASDHGFGPTRDVFHVNSWLEQQGYLFWAAEDERERAATDVGFAEMTRHVNALDWSRTVAYAATPSSQGIHIVDRVPGSDEPLPEQVREQLTLEIARRCARWCAPTTGEPLVEEVWTRRQAFSGPYEQLGPDLSLVLADGGTISILPSRTIVAPPRGAPRPPPLGGHPDRARGPGSARARAPTRSRSSTSRRCCCTSSACRCPRTWPAACPPGCSRTASCERRPVRSAPASDPAAAGPAIKVELAPEEQAAVMERLRALGYVE